MESVIGTGQLEGLDEIDLKVIEALRSDGRVAFAQIAERLNVSPGMIRQRYNRLVEQGFLKVVAITNPLRMGFSTMAMIGIRVDGTRLLDVAEKISKLFVHGWAETRHPDYSQCCNPPRPGCQVPGDIPTKAEAPNSKAFSIANICYGQKISANLLDSIISDHRALIALSAATHIHRDYGEIFL